MKKLIYQLYYIFIYLFIVYSNINAINIFIAIISSPIDLTQIIQNSSRKIMYRCSFNILSYT
jgi:hypothetical protein